MDRCLNDTTTFEIVTVCSHNRTRSVLAMAFLRDEFDRRVGSGVVSVSSLGFDAEGLPPIDATTDAMRRRDIDVSGHRSRAVSAKRLDAADLILTAERDHVMRIASISERAHRRAFTLREFLVRAQSQERGQRDVGGWIGELASSRTARAYLTEKSFDLADPTGARRRRFEAAVGEVEGMCVSVCDALLGTDGVGLGHRTP